MSPADQRSMSLDIPDNRDGLHIRKTPRPGGEGHAVEETTESWIGSAVGEPPSAIHGPVVAVPGVAELERTQRNRRAWLQERLGFAVGQR